MGGCGEYIKTKSKNRGDGGSDSGTKKCALISGITYIKKFLKLIFIPNHRHEDFTMNLFCRASHFVFGIFVLSLPVLFVVFLPLSLVVVIGVISVCMMGYGFYLIMKSMKEL